MTDPIAPVTGSVISDPDAQTAIWFLGALSQVRVSGAQTGGAFAVADHLAQRGNASPVHVHDRDDETFFVLDGELRSSSARRSTPPGPALSRCCPGVFATPMSSPPPPRGSSPCTHRPGSSSSPPRSASPPGPSPCRRHPPDRQISPRWPRLPPGTRSRSWPRRPSPEPARTSRPAVLPRDGVRLTPRLAEQHGGDRRARHQQPPASFGALACGPLGCDPLAGAHLGLRVSPRPG